MHAILSIVGGAGCIFFPSRQLAIYDISLPPMGLVIYQFWGISLMGIGLLTWFLRRVQEDIWRKAIALSLCLIHMGNTIVAIRGQFAGANNSGWSMVVLFAILALSFGYLRLIRLRVR